MLTTDRIANAVAALDDGHGIRLSVSTLNEKCGAVFRLDRDESSDVRSALSSYDVDQTHTPAQAAELAAKVETLGIELAREKRMREETRLDLVARTNESHDRLAKITALQARVDTLVSAEARATERCLAACETSRDALDQTKRAQDQAEEAIGSLRKANETAEKWKAKAEAAEARVKALEGDAVPVGWFNDHHKGYTFCPNKGFNTHPGEGFEPLYRHPPKTGEPVAWLSRTPGVSKWLSFDRSALANIPLYEAPPLAAIGVTNERFASVRTCKSGWAVFTSANDGREVVRRDIADILTALKSYDGDVRETVRLVPIDAPVVDVAAIRKAMSPDRHWVPTVVRAEILAAIGDR